MTDITQSVDATGPVDAPLPARQFMVAVTASLFGWGLDLFDLFILLYVAPTVGKLFFPAHQPMLSLVGVYASFAVTLLMRPLGAALFGSFADRRGRRMAMLVATTGVGIFTAVFGLLPTVGQIGLSATLLFLFFRLVQGVFVGGVIASSHTIGSESAPQRWRGVVSGAVGGAGSAIGGLLASLVFFIVSLLAPGDAFAAWGWRLMFFSGLLTSVVGMLIFLKLEESPAFQQMAARKAARRAQAATEASPLNEIFRGRFLPVLLLNLLLTIGAGGGYYLTSGFMPTFLKLVSKVPGTTASMMLILVALAGAAGAILFGEISEHVGRKPVFIIASLVRVFAFPALYLTMGQTSDITMLGLYAVLLAFLANGSYGPLLIFLNERFPTRLRASGTGLSWNIGYAIGGMMPFFVSLVATQASALPKVLAVFSCGVSIVMLLGGLLMKETKDNLDRPDAIDS